ncbi:MAG: CPBP family intramembrane metalloprotease [Clostridium argentinense]|uniref:CPBP family intramembrane metalloprotease n=1 Tax=Clostridium faecium TaxID=2762223 RepID=A0ABR8YQS2_9CLOT|nr:MULTISPECIES: type II CAAX endopeptidase family protein [Clostridium]MBD8046600.1 CPBP family intramembrane metalloprotease [Clostridium faecium]MBS5825368.1 CPBP family intramembrane metalloprotease [Clostridium argentinense]MDU1350067.1 type II CAAX endopeptidase family protein [Clostridium argentinense]
MEILINILVLLLVYFLPYFVFVYEYSYKKGIYKIFSIKNIFITLVYTLLVIISPPMISNLYPFIIVIILIINIKKTNLYDYNRYEFSIKKIELFSVIKFGFITYIVMIFAAKIWSLILTNLGVNLVQQEVVTILSDYNILTFLIVTPSTVIFAPVLEEFVFRYLLFEKFFKKRIGFILASIITSILFASVHFSLSAFLVLFTISMINCYLIDKKGYWYAVMIHFIVNSMTTIFLFIDKLIK